MIISISSLKNLNIRNNGILVCNLEPTKINTMKEETTEEKNFDIHFNDAYDSNNKGFTETYEEALKYIKAYNGTNHSYFEDYKGGNVSIVCNQTGETVYQEEIF
jgi:hypothetical protein